ncbi:MAG: glycosyltransferase family 2 protein [Alphaproteobacteria bacterium]
MATPQVSIIIPTYNRAKYLPVAIGSIQGQTISDWEAIVVDDGSVDDTHGVLERMSGADLRIRAVANPRGTGPAGARNAGIALARAPFVAFIDSDDFWSPTHLERLLSCFERQPETGLAATNCRMMDMDSRVVTTARQFLTETMLPWWESMPLAREVIPCENIRRDIAAISGRDAILGQTIGGFLWILTTAVMVRRQLFETVGLFDEALQRTEDIDLWLRVNRRSSIAYVDVATATYDITGRDEATGPRYLTQAPERKHSAYRERLHHVRLLERIGGFPDLSKAQRAFVRDRLGALHRQAAQFAASNQPGAIVRHRALSFWLRPNGFAEFLRHPARFMRGSG